MRYQTFDLTVSATGTPHEYLLSAQTSRHGETHAPIKISIVASAAPVADLLTKLANNKISSTDLQTLGKQLYESLFAGEINLLLNRALGETIGRDDLGLRLRLRINPPELAALPWEFLYSTERRLFLAASVETPLSRYLNLPEPLRAIACPDPIRMLVVIPQNTDLDTVVERERLEKIALKITDRSLETLNFSDSLKIKRPVNELRGKIVIDFLEGLATTAAIRASLREKEYHIFHYAGHGAFKNDEAFLYLDHEEKFTEAISAEHFAHFFTDYVFTRLVVLNACQGATRSAHQALAGVAPQLVLRGVPAVIAMQDRIANDDAILFAAEFYEELCNPRDGGQIEAAISRARKALLQERPAVFGNPVLYLRAEDGRLWEEQKPAIVEPAGEVKDKEQKSLLERWGLWVTLIGGILVIIATLADLPEKILKLWESKEVKKEESAATYLRGAVMDLNDEPIADALITLKELPSDTVLTQTTTRAGGFYFEKIPGKVGDRVRVYADKAGYKSQNEYVTLPNPIKFKLARAK